MKKMFVSAGLFFTLATLPAPSVSADDTRPCVQDIERFCRDVPPVHGRIPLCLKAHEKELTPACRARITKVAENMKKAHRACADDIEKFCGDVHPGGGSIIQCLNDHKDKISPACVEEMGNMRHKKVR